MLNTILFPSNMAQRWNIAFADHANVAAPYGPNIAVNFPELPALRSLDAIRNAMDRLADIEDRPLTLSEVNRCNDYFAAVLGLFMALWDEEHPEVNGLRRQPGIRYWMHIGEILPE